MKKLILFFAMVFAVSMVMAQKTTTLVQAGVNNTADVTQMACLSGDDNFIIATQSGNYNGLTTLQVGWNNDIDLKQSGNHNTADMTQETCDYDESHGYNTAKVLQNGHNNTANLSQMEEDGGLTDIGYVWGFPVPINPEMDRSINVADATQSGNSNSYTLNQGRQTHIPDNESYLVQSGAYNGADINQLGFDNYSEIRQPGYDNAADLLQEGPTLFASSSMDVSKSWQTGSLNGLIVKQTGEVDEQLAISRQDGYQNQTEITQVGFTVQNVDARQDGNGDVVNVSQIDFE